MTLLLDMFIKWVYSYTYLYFTVQSSCVQLELGLIFFRVVARFCVFLSVFVFVFVFVFAFANKEILH